jgi:NAD(P)-dependent dehydrogenase (short-subunit alcohol dehydrogenase family)
MKQVKTIVITGASRGIGWHTAQQALAQGHHVVALARNQTGLDELGARTRKAPGRLSALCQDCSDIEPTVAAILEKTDQVDILIHNAAAFLKKEWEALTAEDMEQVYRVNVITPLCLSQALVAHMPRGGHILHIGSVGGVAGSLKFPGLLPYSVSKGALHILSECLAVELADRGIAVNALALGSSDTEMFKAAFPGQEAGSTPEEMSQYVWQFALNAPSAVNGQVHTVSSQVP